MAVDRRREIIEYYNRGAYVEDALRHSLKPGHIEKKLSVLRRYVTGGVCVELGCGAGVYGTFFPQWIGLDISYKALQHARAGGGREVLCDVCAIPLAGGCAKAVFSFNVLEHHPSPERVLEEVDRILAPGGTVILKDSWRRAQPGARQALPKPLASLVRSMGSRMRMLYRHVKGDARIHYKRLVPDYTKIGKDWDAVSSIDEYSVFEFFRHKGYEWVNLRENLLLRMIVPYRNSKHWVIVRKSCDGKGDPCKRSGDV